MYNFFSDNIKIYLLGPCHVKNKILMWANEGFRLKQKTANTFRNIHLSSITPSPSSPHPSPVLTHLTSLTPHPSSLSPYLSSLTPYLSSFLPHPSFPIPTPHLSFLTLSPSPHYLYPSPVMRIWMNYYTDTGSGNSPYESGSKERTSNFNFSPKFQEALHGQRSGDGHDHANLKKNIICKTSVVDPELFPESGIIGPDPAPFSNK